MTADRAIIFGAAWGFFIHATIKWRFGLLEYVIATLAFHRWHHTNDSPELAHKNFAPTLPMIDWFRGKLHFPPGPGPTKYGIDAGMPRGLLRQLVRPLLFWLPMLVRKPPITTE